ncbi:hypothetical protein BC828DRAFT_377265 [Blastocladiella britannica]|nr:hypothetical protein BC828DRAFT_377265 [Blastocladiella britannica]
MSKTATFFSVIVALAAVAFATNPDADSFQKYIEDKLKEDGRSWVERKAAAKVASMLYERKDFKFFSVVNVPEENTRFVGAFSLWITLPMTWRHLAEDARDE